MRIRALRILALGFALLGVVVALWGNGPLFAAWREAAVSALFAGHAPDHFDDFAAMTFGILGGTIAGKWVAAYWLVCGPLQRGERWAKAALAWGLIAWFLVDSGLSIVHGAWFNVWMINVMPMATFGLLLIGVKAERVVPAPPASSASKVLLAASAVSASLGLVIALGVDTPLFSAWHAAAGATLGADRLSPALLQWLGFLAGPIGGTTFAHFVMLTIALVYAPDQRWTLAAVATSVGAWFLIDSACSIARGASFNVWLVNIPALLVVAIPWAWAAWQVRRGAPSGSR